MYVLQGDSVKLLIDMYYSGLTINTSTIPMYNDRVESQEHEFKGL